MITNTKDNTHEMNSNNRPIFCNSVSHESSTSYSSLVFAKPSIIISSMFEKGMVHDFFSFYRNHNPLNSFYIDFFYVAALQFFTNVHKSFILLFILMKKVYQNAEEFNLFINYNLHVTTC